MPQFLFFIDLLAFAFGCWAAGHFGASSYYNHIYRESKFVMFTVRPSMYVLLMLAICWAIARMITS